MNDKEKVFNIESFINIVKMLKDSFAESKELNEDEIKKIRENLNKMKDSIEKSIEDEKKTSK